MWYRIRVSVPNARRARFVVVKNTKTKKTLFSVVRALTVMTRCDRVIT